MDARARKPIRRILLSNDDGVDAVGLKILYDIAIQLGATHIRIGSAFFGDR